MKKMPRRAPEPLAIKTTKRVLSKITPPHSPRPRRCVWHLFFPSLPLDLTSTRLVQLDSFSFDLCVLGLGHLYLSTQLNLDAIHCSRLIHPSILTHLRFVELSSSQADLDFAILLTRTHLPSPNSVPLIPTTLGHFDNLLSHSLNQPTQQDDDNNDCFSLNLKTWVFSFAIKKGKRAGKATWQPSLSQVNATH